MLDDSDWPKLDRYFAGECSDEEAREIARWIKADSDRARQVARIRDVWDGAGKSPIRWDTGRSWERLLARASAREERTTTPTARKTPLSVRSVWPSRFTSGHTIAAACAILVVGAVVVSERYTWQSRSRAAEQPAADREYVTTRGLRANVTLGDGSKLVLAPASRLRVSADYGVRDRTLWLEGCAFFTVRHDSTRPFIVRTARGVVRDLGTEFVVTDYAGERAMRVVVRSGVVALSRAGEGASRDSLGGPPAQRRTTSAVTLTRGDLAEIGKAGVMTLRSGVAVGTYLAWTAGRLEFDNTPLREALPEINRWFEADIRLSDAALADYPLTATLTTESFPTALGVLTTVLAARAERRGNAIVLVRAGKGVER